MMNRRDLLLALGATALPTPVFAAERGMNLRPETVLARIQDKSIEMLGFNGSFPGPEFRIKQNDTLQVRVENGLEDGTLVHWHGIRLPNDMDGVNVLTQDAIEPGNSFDYRFSVPDAGTYWYHSHYQSYEQVSRGLFGPLIVEETIPPDVDQDITVILFDILLDAAGSFDPEFRRDDFATVGRIGNHMTAILSSSQVKLGERLRLRVINPTTDRIFSIRITGCAGYVVALDGMPLTTLSPLTELVLAPGQRVDVIGDVQDEIAILETTYADPSLLASLNINGTQKLRSSKIAPLPENPLPRPGRVVDQIDIVMQGGVGSAPHGGFGTWAFNDVSGLPRKPLVSVRRGETVRIRLHNKTAFPHGIHLHGHHFWETSSDGNPTQLRDTTLVDANETRAILCVLDNPGSWMLHCHMLSHQADGMATWLHVR